MSISTVRSSRARHSRAPQLQDGAKEMNWNTMHIFDSHGSGQKQSRIHFESPKKTALEETFNKARARILLSPPQMNTVFLIL